MNIIVFQLLIISSIFIFILWFQYIYDKKNNKIRTSIYDKYKLPVLISSIIGLIIYYLNIQQKNSYNNKDNNYFNPFMIFNNKKYTNEQLVYTEMPNF